MIKIRQLIWDDWNVKHISSHKVSPREVEEACKLIKKIFKTYKERLIILGKTKKGRLITVVLAKESKGKYYVVTARDISKKERRLLK